MSISLNSHAYAYEMECWADNARGTLGCLQAVCAIPAVREAIGDDDLITNALEYQDDEAIGWLADEIEGLEVPAQNEGWTWVLEWREGDIMAVSWRLADGLCCDDCLMMMASGDLPHDMEEDSEEAQAIIAGTANRCPASVLEGYESSSFSWHPCDCCGSKLGGDRYPYHCNR